MATKLDLADAQFIGFHYGKRESWIVRMVEDMALTRDEWETWKHEYNINYLKPSERKEIDDYFKREKLNNK